MLPQNSMLHALAAVLMLSGQAVPQSPPPAAPRPPAQTAPRTPPPVYNETADAKAAIDAAIHAAATDDVRVLINWGANDNEGSKRYAQARALPEIVKSTPSFFSDEYKGVNVDVGHLDRNVSLAASYGVKLSAASLPALTVLDAAGKVVVNIDAAALRPDNDPAAIDAVKLAAFLKSHQAPAPDATAQFEAALKQAKRDGKTVFVWFSAPW